MHALLELLPLLSLVAGYFIGKSINPDEAMYYLAYGAIIGTLLQFAVYKLSKQKMPKMTFITGIFLIVFASITIIFHNDLFIQLKPTVLSWLFAIFFWGYAFIKKRSILEQMMGAQFDLSAQKWLTLNWAWVVYNFLIGAANLFVVWQIQQGIWESGAWLVFKGALLPISLVFIAGQTVYLFKNGKIKNTANDSNDDNDNNDIQAI